MITSTSFSSTAKRRERGGLAMAVNLSANNDTASGISSITAAPKPVEIARMDQYLAAIAPDSEVALFYGEVAIEAVG